VGEYSVACYLRNGDLNFEWAILGDYGPNGSESSISSKISEHIFQFYTRLYPEQFSWQPNLDGLSFNVLSVWRRQCGWKELLRRARSLRW
jgi:hypothetical protein